MKILITGGTGFIGQHFMAKYADHDYTVLTRDINRAQRLLGSRPTLIRSLDELSLQTSFDAIINLAGEPIVGRRWCERQKQKLTHSRWKMTESLVDWMARAETKPKVFLSGSAIGVYGVSLDARFDETQQATRRDFSTQLCERWEREAKLADSFTRVVLLRTGIVLSDDGGALDKMLLPFKMGLGGKVGSGKQWMSWIHMDDYVSAINYLLNNEQSKGAYNLTAPEPVANSRFVKALADALHRPCWMPLPAYALKLALGEASTLLLDGQYVVPQRLINEGFSFSFPTVESAMKDIFAQ